MASEVKPIPDGCEGAAPYLCVNDASAAIEFYKKAFGAMEVYRLTEPSGKIVIMLADEYLEYGHRSPQSLGGTPVKIHLYVEDADAVVSQAYDAGAKILQPVKDEFYGDRGGKLEDPFGHVWLIATRKEDVATDEIQKRFAAFFDQ